MPRRRIQASESLEAKVDAVRRAVWQRNDKLGEDSPENWWVFDIFDEFVVVRQGRQLMQVPYTFDEHGVVQFGEAKKVEMDLEPVQMAVEVEANAQLLEAAADEKEGWVWGVDIIAPGWALTNDFYSAEAIAAAAPLFEGVKVYAFPETHFAHKRNPMSKGFREIIGWISDPQVEDDGRVTGRMNFVQAGLADEVRTRMTQAWKAGNKDLLGLSIDARGKVFVIQGDGRTAREIREITEVLSVDAVLRPAAGGKFTELVAGLPATEPKESQMKEKLLKLLRARRPDALAGIDEEKATVEQILAAVPDDEWEKLFTAEDAGAGDGEGGTEVKKEEGEADPIQAADSAALARIEKMETRAAVGELLQASKLPEKTQDRLRSRFRDQVASREQIQAAIDEERDYLAALNPARVSGLGGAREGAGLVAVGAETIDKIQAGFDRSFGLEPEDASLKTIKPLGLRRLYDLITCGEDPDVTGVVDDRVQAAMVQAAFTNATLNKVVANTMHRKLLKDYREVDYKEGLFYSKVTANDFRNREAIRLGYFGDLPAVDPESADYAEIAAYGDEAETYAVGQKGGIVTITRKHIINDDVGAVAKVAGRLGRAARRTFAKFIYGFFTTNGAMSDSENWMSVAHANLLTVAMSVAQLTANRLKLYNQTEPDSSEKLALDLFYLLVPIDLEDTAQNINQTDKVPGSANNDANRWYHKFGENNERIITVPFWTDANDWFTTANPADVDILEVAFLNGQEEPELWIADVPTVGQMFTADKLQYKIRHEYGGAPVDHRGVVGNIVA